MVSKHRFRGNGTPIQLCGLVTAWGWKLARDFAQRGAKVTSRASLESSPILRQVNDGVFPVNAIYEVIDGRKSIKAHGTRGAANLGVSIDTIPKSSSWFNCIRRSIQTDLFESRTPVARSRVLAVVDYLNRIQAK